MTERRMNKKMSVLWFIMILLAFKNGIKIDDISFLILAIFYVGDCILVRNRKANDETD